MNKIIRYLNWALLLGGFLYWSVPGLYDPLWWDEINSFLFYSLHDTNHTLTSLKTANNHIFFNYFMNIYSDKLNIRNIDQIMVMPHVFRIPMFISSLLAVFFTYKAGQLIGGPSTGKIAAVILITTIPFMNYALQLRGYSFSILFLAAALYFIFNFQEKGKLPDMLMIPVSVFLLLFTLLSNVYVIISIGLFILVQVLWVYYKRKGTSKAIVTKVKQGAVKKTKKGLKITPKPRLLSRRVYLWSLLLVGVGVLISLYMYLPVWDDFLALNKRDLASAPPYRFFVLAELLPGVIVHFLSYRFLLLVVFGIMIWLLFKQSFRISKSRLLMYIMILMIVFLTPFLLSFINNNHPFDRTFIVLVPVFSLLVAGATELVISYFEALYKRKEIIVTGVILYCVITLFVSNIFIQKHLANNIQLGKREQTLTYNYYLSDLFRPLDQIDEFKDAIKENKNIPVISFNDVDMIALTYGANLKGIKYYKMNWEKPVDSTSVDATMRINNVADYWESSKESPAGYKTWQLKFTSTPDQRNLGKSVLIQYLKQNKSITNKFYAVTGFPDEFKKELKTILPNALVKELFSKESYNNFFEVSLNE